MRAKVSLSRKCRSRPSISPGRCGRVVTLTECQICGWRSRRYSTTVLLPTPAGPDNTVRRLGPTVGDGATDGEFSFERLSLMGAETSHAPRRRDTELFHDALRADL